MYRDFTLAVALAVLLIGSTAAFFFRTPSDPAAGLPRLQDPEKLDGLIARRDVMPYLGADDLNPAAGADAKAPSSPWAKPAFLTHKTTGSTGRLSLTPDPIQLSMEEEMESFETGGLLQDERQIENGLTAGIATRTHVVQAGDTLTGLAAKYFGSLARYREIFELNRDQLEAPDDLQVGMTLRLPSAPVFETPPAFRPAAATRRLDMPSAGTAKPRLDSAGGTASGTDARAADPPGRGPIEETGGRLFVPARKAPFVPGRYRAPGAQSGNDPADQGSA